MSLEWKEFGGDWQATGPDGTHFAAKRVVDAGDGTRWVIAWTERDGVRIGIGSFASLDKAKRECEELAGIA